MQPWKLWTIITFTVAMAGHLGSLIAGLNGLNELRWPLTIMGGVGNVAQIVVVMLIMKRKI